MAKKEKKEEQVNEDNEEEIEERKSPRKYERREFLKQTGRVGLGAAVYGGVGYLAGRTYKVGQDTYREYVKPMVDGSRDAADRAGEVIDTTVDKAKETGQRLGDWWRKNFNKRNYESKIKERQEKEEQKRQEELEKQRQLEEAEKMSRRGFFNKYFHLFNEHPVGTGTATGVALGGAIKSLTLYPQYLDKKKIARLRDKQIDNEEKLETLKEYYKDLKKDSKNKDGKIDKLEQELEKVYKILNMNEKDSSGLEEKVEETEIKNPMTMLLSGIALIIGFILINGVDYTGFSVLSQDYFPTSSFLGVIIIFTSLILIIIGIIRIRNIEKRHKTKKVKSRKKNN
jgi:hypothetical protein